MGNHMLLVIVHIETEKGFFGILKELWKRKKKQQAVEGSMALEFGNFLRIYSLEFGGLGAKKF
ncbi:hypothetical protein CUMW_051220 [Citrus unshiu]|nr:hypothetical protein CUMW_051220 [Citrus unshiu]